MHCSWCMAWIMDGAWCIVHCVLCTLNKVYPVPTTYRQVCRLFEIYPLRSPSSTFILIRAFVFIFIFIFICTYTYTTYTYTPYACTYLYLQSSPSTSI